MKVILEEEEKANACLLQAGGRGASGKTIVFGLYKRNGYVYTVSVCDTRTYTLYNIIKEKVTPDSIVYTDLPAVGRYIS